MSGVIIKKKRLVFPNKTTRVLLPSAGQGNVIVVRWTFLATWDKMSSRVVLENDGAAHGKVTGNIFIRQFLGKRKSHVRLVDPIPSSRILPHFEEKPKNRAGSQRSRPAIQKREKSSGRRQFLSKLEQEVFSLIRIYFCVMLAAVVLRKNQRIILDCVCGQRSLSFVTLLKKFLCSVTRSRKKKEMMIGRERKKLDNSEVKQQKR